MSVSLPCRKNYAGNHNYNAINRSCQYVQCVPLNGCVCEWEMQFSLVHIQLDSREKWNEVEVCMQLMLLNAGLSFGIISSSNVIPNQHTPTKPSERVENVQQIFSADFEERKWIRIVSNRSREHTEGDSCWNDFFATPTVTMTNFILFWNSCNFHVVGFEC